MVFEYILRVLPIPVGLRPLRDVVLEVGDMVSTI